MFADQLAGCTEESAAGMSFEYSNSWLQDPKAQPVSLALPLREEPYESRSG